MAKNHQLSMTDAIKSAIRDSGLSLNALARETGVQVSSLSRFMRGEQDLVFGAVENLAAVLGLELRRTAKPAPQSAAAHSNAPSKKAPGRRGK
jgi:transcriptional regulator with XRE-family HTH domain